MLSRAIPKNHVPRRDRDLVRAHRAGDRVLAAGGTHADAALETAQVLTLDPCASISRFKATVELALARGPHNPASRARYGRFACTAWSIDDAIEAIEFTHSQTRDCDFSRDRRNRLTFLTIRELRLILRWLRRYSRADFPQILAALTQQEDAHG